jgi:hypothetical protein
MFFVWVSRVILSLLSLLPTFPLCLRRQGGAGAGAWGGSPAHGVPADHPWTRARMRARLRGRELAVLKKKRRGSA